MYSNSSRAKWKSGKRWYCDMNTLQYGTILCEIHIDSSRNDAIVPGIFPITPIKWCPPFHVVDHASKNFDSPPGCALGIESFQRPAMDRAGKTLFAVGLRLRTR